MILTAHPNRTRQSYGLPIYIPTNWTVRKFVVPVNPVSFLEVFSNVSHASELVNSSLQFCTLLFGVDQRNLGIQSQIL
jgi:hypothetical protein